MPEYLPTVQVMGAVTSPTSVLYRAGAGLGYYIDNAGVYARDADEGRTSVRYANGSAGVRTQPGSTVSVPQRDPTDRFDPAGFLANLASVVGSIMTVIVVLTR